jgi:SAM-dependent methyltransferase
MSIDRHEDYEHYSPEAEKRLNGFYGTIDCYLNHRIAKFVKGRRVLDIGCGFGSLVEHLRLAKFEAVGIDLLPDFVAAGHIRYPAADLRCVRRGKLPFADQSFDTLVLKDTIHHIFAEDDSDQFLAEVRRVCAHRIIVMDPNPTIILLTTRRLIRRAGPICAPHQCSQKLEAAGFTVIHRQFHELVGFPASGGFVGREFVKSARVGDAVLALDRACQKFLDWIGLASSFCTRYTIVADAR